MKLQLLLQREPIGEIIERTLTNYWSRRYRSEVDVTWHPPRNKAIPAVENAEKWLANATLNVIFPMGISPQQLETVRREFSFSLQRWRQPLQSAYVNLALHPRTAAWFRCATLTISPPLPDGQDWILIPGNRKLRLLNDTLGQCAVLAKDGFPRASFQQEIEASIQASELGVSVPSITDAKVSEGWYIETLVVGTPLNRFTDAVAQQRVAAKAMQQLLNLTLADVKIRDAAEYASELHAAITRTVLEAGLIDRFGLAQTPEVTDALASMAASNSMDVTVPWGMTHGDFQPANILVDGETFWIIDWELARPRQAGYDLMVFEFLARSPSGLGERLRRWQQDMQARQALVAPNPALTGGATSRNQGGVQAGTVIDHWLLQHLRQLDQIDSLMSAWHYLPDYDWRDPQKQAVYLSLFLMEELQWRLEQLAPPIIQCSIGGIEGFVAEVQRWLLTQGHRQSHVTADP